VLNRFGIETRLQAAITVCVISLVVVTTFGGSAGAPWAFFVYRSLLLAICVLTLMGCRNAEMIISRRYIACVVALFVLMLISVLRVRGSHFDAFYLWTQYALFGAAFLPLAWYARHQSARWKGLLSAVVVSVGLLHLLPDILLAHEQVAGFSRSNANYFATFLLVGLAASAAAAVFGTGVRFRVTAGVVAAILVFGILKTGSRGGAVAMLAMVIVAGIRSRGRFPRHVWLAAGLMALVVSLAASPFLVRKFIDRGEQDPYNYARVEIWRSSLSVVGHTPLLGVGFGQFMHISKRFTLPVEGIVARYLKRARIAHNEYLQHMAEIGIPAAILLVGLLAYPLYVAWKRSATAWPEYRWFHEAALLTATGVGVHALVDNCWTIPVTAAAMVAVSMADPLPVQKASRRRRWTVPKLAISAALAASAWVYAITIPALGLYYNDLGHRAYDASNFDAAKALHLKAIAIVPDHPLFLDNLGMVYFQEYSERNDPKLLELARQYFAKAIDASPNALDPYIHMEGVLLRSLTGNFEKDRHTFEEIVRIDTRLLDVDPYIPFARKNLAGAYYNLGQTEHALQELQTAIHYEPNYVPGYLQLAEWYAVQGNSVRRDQNTAAAMQIVNRYRDYKPREHYESLLLGRPDGSFLAQIKRNP